MRIIHILPCSFFQLRFVPSPISPTSVSNLRWHSVSVSSVLNVKRDVSHSQNICDVPDSDSDSVQWPFVWTHCTFFFFWQCEMNCHWFQCSRQKSLGLMDETWADDHTRRHPQSTSRFMQIANYQGRGVSSRLIGNKERHSDIYHQNFIILEEVLRVVCFYRNVSWMQPTVLKVFILTMGRLVLYQVWVIILHQIHACIINVCFFYNSSFTFFVLPFFLAGGM